MDQNEIKMRSKQQNENNNKENYKEWPTISHTSKQLLPTNLFHSSVRITANIYSDLPNVPKPRGVQYSGGAQVSITSIFWGGCNRSKIDDGAGKGEVWKRRKSGRKVGRRPVNSTVSWSYYVFKNFGITGKLELHLAKS